MADADKQAKVEALEKEIKELQEKLKADEGNAGKLEQIEFLLSEMKIISFDNTATSSKSLNPQICFSCMTSQFTPCV